MNWHICDVDATQGRTLRQGEGLEMLMEALRDIMTRESEHTEEGKTTSGNVALYWWIP